MSNINYQLDIVFVREPDCRFRFVVPCVFSGNISAGDSVVKYGITFTVSGIKHMVDGNWIDVLMCARDCLPGTVLSDAMDGIVKEIRESCTGKIIADNWSV